MVRAEQRPAPSPCRFSSSTTKDKPRMPELSVVVITADEDQKALLQVLVDSTAIAHMTHAFGAYPQSDGDPVLRRIQDLKPEVILVDLPPGVTVTALRAVEVL